MSKPDPLRGPLGPAERLSVTKWYLVIVDAFSTIVHSYGMNNASVGRIVKETCNVLLKRLPKGEFIKVKVAVY